MLLTLLEWHCQQATIWMDFCLSLKLKSVNNIKLFASTFGILRSGLGALPAVVSCFNPTFKSGTLRAAHLVLKIWIHPWSACSVMIFAKLHTTTGSACRHVKSFDRKKHSLGLSAVTHAWLAHRSSVRVQFRDGGPSCTIISNETR